MGSSGRVQDVFVNYKYGKSLSLSFGRGRDEGQKQDVLVWQAQSWCSVPGITKKPTSSNKSLPKHYFGASFVEIDTLLYRWRSVLGALGAFSYITPCEW